MGWLEKGPSASLFVRYVSHRICSSLTSRIQTLFEANGVPPTHDSMHQVPLIPLRIENNHDDEDRDDFKLEIRS